jgi:hypothetical protein
MRGPVIAGLLGALLIAGCSRQVTVESVADQERRIVRLETDNSRLTEELGEARTQIEALNEQILNERFANESETVKQLRFERDDAVNMLELWREPCRAVPECAARAPKGA